jgi:4-alpha-glucanotransferase
MRRGSGILLHITSLPNQHGIGDLGKCAYDWIDFLAASQQQYWQVLPLGPTGFGNSPYSSCSAFAGNPLLINLDQLVTDGLLTASDIDPYDRNEPRVRFERVRQYKQLHLQKAFKNFTAAHDYTQEFEKFCEESEWLEKFSDIIGQREKRDAEYIRFEQFLFQRQLLKLKAYATVKGVKLIGDLPMYVSEDSVDKATWPELFDMESGFVAGSPPSDAFPMGQRWGNPLFRWDRHRETRYEWWIRRIQWTLQQVDVIRLDYFCGYSEFWATNGQTGHWRRGPQHDLLNTTRQKLGTVPFIAEDLGELTPEINRLRDDFGILSTKVLHYAFDGQEDNPYLPENWKSSNCVVYTGTHDNDTTKGWYEQAPEYIKENVRREVEADGRDISWDLIKLAAKSRADLVIIPYQDVLCLGREARFNTPGTVTNNNWSWRAQPQQIDTQVSDGLSWLAKSTQRV